jgi:hypothetical protein
MWRPIAALFLTSSDSSFTTGTEITVDGGFPGTEAKDEVMQINVTLPFDQIDKGEEFLTPEAVAGVGAALERARFGYDARDCRILSAPRQKPHPPLLIRGNSHGAIRRAVELGDAWYPFPTTPQVSATSRTALISTEADLESGIRHLNEQCEKQGRMTPPDIILAGPPTSGETSSARATVDQIRNCLTSLLFLRGSSPVRVAIRSKGVTKKVSDHVKQNLHPG